MKMIYLSGTYTQVHEDLRPRFGYMLNAMRKIGSESEALQYPWMLDNGVFGNRWQEDIWLSRLEELSEYRETCLGVVVPDVIGDHDGTLDQWKKWAPYVRQNGLMALFVAQTGCAIDNIPWDDADGIFIGDTEKRRVEWCFPIIAEGVRRGKWVHVGRVNSVKAVRKYRSADSVDGTHFKFSSTRRDQENILWETEKISALKRQGPLFTLD